MKKKNKAAQELGRLRHKKSPIPKEKFSEMGKLGAKVRWGDKNENKQQNNKSD